VIINIGLSKTGNKSLATALTMSGYNCKHLPTITELFSGKYDAYTDIPCYAYLRQLLLLYPNIKLLCTTRELSSWLMSCEQHFKPTDNPYLLTLRNLVYGTTVYNRAKFIEAYYRHRATVSNIKGCVEIPLEHPDKWSILCDALNLLSPTKPYPCIK
jgi:hypothetical protein